MHDTVVYLGPSLSPKVAEHLLCAQYLPPICRGDLARLPEHVRFVGIVDGEFFQRLAVSPKEVLAVLQRGVKVFGASSMGALRAVETEMFGTIGLGEVFAMFRDGVLDGDDEVALVYEPETYRKLSEPLVNLRAAVRQSVAAGVICDAHAVRLIAEMKATYFPHRSYKALQRLCPPLTEYFARADLPDLKRDDAIELLAQIKRTRDAEQSPNRNSQTKSDPESSLLQPSHEA